MCLHRSYIVTENYKVLSVPDGDHHTNIRNEHKLRDDMHDVGSRHASIECRPVKNLFDLPTWNFHIDEKIKPNWWTKEHQSKALSKLESDFKRYHKDDSTYIFPGDLDLSKLHNLPERATIIADGYILLDSIYELPPDCVIIARKQGISFQSLRYCHGRSNLVAPEIRVAHPEIIRDCVVADKCRQYNPTRDRYDDKLQSYKSMMYGYNIPMSPSSMFIDDPFAKI